MFDFNAQDLRKNPTHAEIILWGYLRARQMLGLKFRRQHPLGPFIVDFICLSKKVVVEMDGPIHDERKAYDQKRDMWLKMQGFTVIRFRNEELIDNPKDVLFKLRNQLLQMMGFRPWTDAGLPHP